MSSLTEVTFESGYARLQAIARRLAEEEVPVSEMCDLFAEGKGLEQALTAYLDQQRQRIESIENGEGIQAFRVVAPSGETGGPRVSGARSGPTPRGDIADELPF